MIAALVLAVLAAPEAPPIVDGLPVVLRWNAVETCPTEQALRSDVESLAGAPILEDPGAEVVDAKVTAIESGFALDVARRSASGDTIEARHLEAETCEPLARATALIVAVNVAPLRVSTTVRTWEREAAEAKTQPKAEVTKPEPEREPEPELEPEPTPAPVFEPPPTRTPRPDRDWKHQLIAGGLGGIGVGSVPVVGGMLAGWAGYAYGPFRLELSGQHTFATTQDISQGIAVRASASGGGATFVFAPRLSPIRALIGTGIRAGVLQGAGRGARVDPRDASDWWMTVPVIVGAAYPADFWVALRGQAEVWVGLRRPAIEIRADGDSLGEFRTAPVGLSVLIGPEFRLP